ncbi:TlyA family RNA methyltransferase [[Mycoplasma] mobile]|uniref:Putative rRNA methylase n=1 Tax=Mycoplasma mobile (strain ATCC 43663 / 163K / NCTC 11711) TaxID=267748 RepID=Q6KIL0_MYCM1|nr:TlyA family RNA methyltransferase [[Mycoplasma] mobile]AAT27566.1 putative rRNA methylase [Mycoplasma mobile 163K]
MKIKLIDRVIEKFDFTNSKASLLIRNKQIIVNKKIIADPNFLTIKDDEILLNNKKEYVSRGAYKLLDAIEEFNLKKEIKNKIVLDIGSSTGGFIEVLLKYGAEKVFALDVGTNQLDYSLRINPKVISKENTNLKQISKNLFSEKIELVTCDVSFISSKEVFKVLNFLDKGVNLILLIKPQFEANSSDVLTGGIVNKEIHNDIINKVINYGSESFLLKSIKECKIKGKKSKNTEYISLFERK